MPETHSKQGEYDSWFAFTLPGSDESLWPNQDGFLVHDACWQLLHLVHKTTKPGQRPLDPRRVYLTMMARVTDCNDTYLRWRDPRLYGGTTQFAGQEWEAFPGYEVHISKNCLTSTNYSSSGWLQTR